MKQLLKNLSEAKKEIGAISKDSKNPFFKSAYFDINQLLEHVEPILLSKGLLLVQPILDGKVYSVIYDIESGEKLESSLELPAITDPQKILACITYFRRGTLTSLLSIQAEDDDGNKASEAPKKVSKPVKPKTPTPTPQAKVSLVQAVEMLEGCLDLDMLKAVWSEIGKDNQQNEVIIGKKNKLKTELSK